MLLVEGNDIGVWWRGCGSAYGFKQSVKPHLKKTIRQIRIKNTTPQRPKAQHAGPRQTSTQPTPLVRESSQSTTRATQLIASTNVTDTPTSAVQPESEAKLAQFYMPSKPSVTPLDTELTPSTQSPPSSTYILGPLSSTLPPGKHSAIKVDNVTYGLYERTSSGIIAVQNETYTPTAEPPHTAPPTQPTTIDFTYPIYPAVVMSNSTAVSQVVSQTVPWMYRLANAVWSQYVVDSTMAVLPYAASASVLAAIAGAVYCHCNRQPQKKKAGAVTDSNGPLDIDSLWGMEMVRSDISRPAKERRPLLRRKETSF
eukprot:Blabericola_migrator_1__2627@NODE_1742_length_3882_cov_128_785583_g799_i3_p2_GENE_NODE_1742_length_3882_cov_128_785583_g799_i3NODE_1742_length_3882_cov_128_785583_g799_i3_p2_ORF_typecomplete_len312_score44_25_NODE_1742_length_3882_cov_128_785583_g799_i34731408